MLSALCNVAFGLSSAVVAFGLIWKLNGWFQGMGFPPCARLMTHWFPPQRLCSYQQFCACLLVEARGTAKQDGSATPFGTIPCLGAP